MGFLGDWVQVLEGDWLLEWEGMKRWPVQYMSAGNGAPKLCPKKLLAEKGPFEAAQEYLVHR